ncbi:glycosyl hydrolase family 43 protein [Thozetella sp. PMI_491]|nr:glycosyl hydrolase family 43 protein [Thozetella sp. PMI_491]
MKLSFIPAGLLSLGIQCVSAAPSKTLVQRPAMLFALDTATNKSAVVSRDFPDPAIVQDTDGQWYTFATAGNGNNIQVAKASSPGGPWTYLNQDALPSTGDWTTGANSWAPDVRVLGSGKYVMYYSGELASDTRFHCVGTATASSILGPYTPSADPLTCPESQGGAIDPSGFLDIATNRRYVVYKIDGNSIGHGGSCNNGVEPFVATPLMLQEVQSGDGVTPIGDPVQLLDRTQEEDGPLVEAPNLIRTSDGTYVLFYSSHCWSSPEYNVNYALAKSVTGPYTRSPKPLIGTGDFGTTAPGGATSIEGGGKMVFHANCAQGRCMFQADFAVVGANVIVS